MTLLEATRELRRLSPSAHQAIEAECSIHRTGAEELNVKWYTSDHGWSGAFASLDACVEHFTQVLSTVPAKDLEVGDVRPADPS